MKHFMQSVNSCMQCRNSIKRSLDVNYCGAQHGTLAKMEKVYMQNKDGLTETKLTRLITGEGDRGVRVAYTMDFDMTEDIWKLVFSTRSVTFAQVIDILKENDVRSMEVVDIYENSNLILRVENFDANR